MLKPSLNDIPDASGIREAIRKKQTDNEFLADLKARQVYAQSVYQNQSVSNNSIPKEAEKVNIDSNAANGYNENRGGINELSNRTGTLRGNQQPQETNSGGVSQGRRTWEEDEESFVRRTQENQGETGRGRRILVKNGNSHFAYTPAKSDNSEASRAVDILKSIGIDAIYCDGDTESNKNGKTTVHSEAVTTPDGKVYVSSNSSLSSIHIAAHEAVHVNDFKQTEAYKNYESVINDNVLWGSDAYFDIASRINQGNYGGKYDINDISFANKFIRELTAYVNEFVSADIDKATEIFSSMFEDWDAVVEASKQFNKDIGADFTESALLMPQKDGADTDSSSDESILTEPTVKNSEADPIRDYVFELSGRQSYTQEQLKVVAVARKFGRKVIFEDTTKTQGFKSDAYYDNDGNIHFDYDNVKPLEWLLKHELTHFGEGTEEYKNYVDALRETKAYKEWLQKELRTDEESLGKLEGLMRDKLIKERERVRERARERGAKTLPESLDPIKAQAEIIANFSATFAFTKDSRGIEALTADMSIKEHNAFVQFLIDFISYLKKKLGSSNKTLTYELSVLEDRYHRMLTYKAQNPTANNDSGNASEEKNNANKYSISNETIENENEEGYNVSRANEEGDNINEFYSALDRGQWRNFYKKIAENGYLEKKKVGDFISLVVGDKLILAERQWTGKDAHDFQVIDVYRVNDYADSYILNELKDILDESGLYDAKSIAKIVHQFNQGNGQTEIATRFDRNNGTFRNGIASGKQEDISGTAVGIYQNQSHRSGIYDQDEQHIQGIEGGISSANNSKVQYSIPTEADELLDRYESGEISRDEYKTELDELYNRSVDTFGPIKRGEKAQNETNVPRRVEKNKNTHRFVRTIIESDALTDEMLDDVKTDIILGNFSYKAISDETAKKKVMRFCASLLILFCRGINLTCNSNRCLLVVLVEGVVPKHLTCFL